MHLRSITTIFVTNVFDDRVKYAKLFVHYYVLLFMERPAANCWEI